MKKFLLFVYAEDANPFADDLLVSLRSQYIDSTTYTQKLRQASLGKPIIHALEEMVEEAFAVVAIASPHFKDERYRNALVSYAAANGNLIALLPDEIEKELIPFGFTSNGVLGPGLDVSKATEKIIDTLTHF